MAPNFSRLLIIEDDATYREILSRSMSRRGFEVAAAPDPDGGLSTARAFAPDCALLDLNLAGQSGLALIAPLLDLEPSIRIVVLTGYASIQTAVGAIRLGASEYLPKPASVGDIVRALRDDDSDDEASEDSECLTVRHLEWEYIQRTLAEHGGNIAATARALKMHRRTLQRKLARRRSGEFGN